MRLRRLYWKSAAGYPFPILTEERGWQAGQSTEPYLWVVDPLDGSFNYYNDIPVCCVSIVLYHANKPVLGVIYDFNRHELFSLLLSVRELG